MQPSDPYLPRDAADDHDPPADRPEFTIGYGRPPQGSRFKPGRSGNPKGRPRGRHNRPPYDAVLGQKVVLREGGVERTATAAEAFLLYLTKRGLEGDGAAARAAAAPPGRARPTPRPRPRGARPCAGRRRSS